MGEERRRQTLDGLVVTRYDHAVPCDRIEVVEAACPVPDAAGRDAAARFWRWRRNSALTTLPMPHFRGWVGAPLPADGLTVDDKQNNR